jgi:hypothetical protein
MNIDFIGSDAIVQTPDVAFTYQVSETPRDFSKLRGVSNTLDWSNYNNYHGDYIVFPFGSNNDLPEIIKYTVQENYIAPGTLKRKTELLYGGGPRLYKEELVDNKVTRTWMDIPLIQKWLDKFDYQDYLLKSCVDYQYLQGVFTRFELNKGYKVGKPFINSLSTVSPDQARLACIRATIDKQKDPTHVIVTDWRLNHLSSITEAKVYKLIDPQNPLALPNAIMYSNFSTFCTDYYTVPDIYGSLEWLNRSTSVPLIFKALSKNSINLKYHIISPQSFWDKKRNEIEAKCQLKQVTYQESMLLDYQTEFLKKISEVLASEANTGKYLHTTKSFRVDQTNLIEEGWEVKVIDQNIKDFVLAQIKISERADAALSSGMNLHPVLGNINNSGSANSGSEQIMALINYLNTGVNIQEMIITKAINLAIRANFPEEEYAGVKIGFFQNVPERQAEVSPADRSINTAKTK